MTIADRPSDRHEQVAAVVRAAEELLRDHRPTEELRTTQLEGLAEHFPELGSLISYRWFRYREEIERAVSRLDQLLSYIQTNGRIGQQWREQARYCALALLDLYYHDAAAHLTREAKNDYALRLKRFDEPRAIAAGWEVKNLAAEKAPIPQQGIDRTLLLVSLMERLGITPIGWSIAHAPAAQAGTPSVLLLELGAEIVEVARWKD